MPSILEECGGDETVRGVFDDVYGQVRSFTDQLDAMRVAEYGEGSSEKRVPGTGLRMNWGSGFSRGGNKWKTTHITVDEWRSRHLLASTVYWYTPDSERPVPTEVTGWRGNEVVGDYLLRNDPHTHVLEGRLVGLGVSRLLLSASESVLVGSSRLSPEDRLKTLEPTDVGRLTLIRRGILDGLGAAELIQAGTSVSDVFEMLDREPARL